MGKSQRMQNVNGAGKSYLDVVARKDISSPAVSQASKGVKKEYQDLVKNVLTAVKQEIIESDEYVKTLNLKQADIIMMRVAKELDNFGESFASDQLVKVKDEIIEGIKQTSYIDVLKDFIISSITNLFDDNSKKQNIDDLKVLLKDISSKQGEGQEGSGYNQEQQSGNIIQSQKTDSITEDSNVGDDQDSTNAKIFYILQNVIGKQLDILNENVKSFTGLSSLSGFVGFTMNGITTLLSGVSNLTENIADFSKNVVSKIVNISKYIGEGSIRLLTDTIKGISSTVVGAVNTIGKLGKRVTVGFSKIGNGLKGIRSKVGGAILHPFKTIGNFFGNRKKNKIAEKKEKAREKFMNFMMTMFEKLWNFLEPILFKLKIFMLAAFIPIMTTAATVILILTGVILAGVLIYMIAMWVKEKILKLWNYIVSGEMLDDIISGLKAAWEWIVDFGSYLWNKFLDFGYWLFVEIPAKIGKWIWNQLVAFGKWLYDKFIFPYIVKPIVWLRDKITSILTPIMEKLQPFIESAQNLFARIKSIWDNFQWDENKSFFENLKCLASIVKDSVLDWWNNSPFKTFYYQYLDPIVKDLGELYQKIMNIFGTWDSNKSFFENIKDIGILLIDAFRDWWKDSTIKVYWDKLVELLDNTKEKFVNLWNSTKIGQWINGLAVKIKALKNKLPGVTFSILKYTFRPFGPLVGLPFTVSKEQKDLDNTVSKEQKDLDNKQAELDEINKRLQSGDTIVRDWGKLGFGKKDISDELKAKAAKLQYELDAARKSKEQPSVVQQQVTNAMLPVNNINGMNTQTNLGLQQAGEEISTKAVEAEKAADQYRQQQSLLGSQTLDEMRQMREEMRKGFKDPTVIPFPMPYGAQLNPAVMEVN